MADPTHPVPEGLQGLVMASSVDGHPVTIALARRGEKQVEAIMRDGEREFRAKADLLLDDRQAVMDVLMDALVAQYREANADPVWSVS